MPWKICHPSIVLFPYLLSLNSRWFGGFLSHFKGFFILDDNADNLVTAEQEKNYSMLHCTISMQLSSRMKAEWEKMYSNLAYPNRHRTVLHLAVSTHTLGPVHFRRGGGGGVVGVGVGCWQ